jgi:hypothetical protein
MKFGKLLLAVVGATVLLGALTSAASARTFSSSSQTQAILWRVMTFRSSIGEDIVCEVLLAGSLHSRAQAKVINSLVGYFTAGTVLRCAAGGATINQTSFPWHRRYGGFTGTLPNITGLLENVSGAEWNIREPRGLTCRVRRETSSNRGITTVGGGVVTRTEVSGTSRCSAFGFEFNGTLEGTETNIAERLGGARITVTLI